ncbi:unnamed protein product [Didymodactylos carnosus]|uniref:Uncharacterized protein n=1 Tax=Didymodactylos carnosus TaxID=1234261 RepID=A0A813TLN3_9BILA|nr:unnamed protein product [Didymodactylos carnosus]CAF0815576.1 unnamed protein product [Didymodactylos carnosus]CAF3510694.1 unnamed protein product [Didymodactylos carnosus]CAF3601635.1 unnamed protein product [Didymodactylos carnosus]
MFHLLLSRSLSWPSFLSPKPPSSTDVEPTSPISPVSESSSQNYLESNITLSKQVQLSKNKDVTQSLVKRDVSLPVLPDPKQLEILGKHYLTREDLEKLVQLRFQQETPMQRVKYYLWKDELGRYPVYARRKDYTCVGVSIIQGHIYGTYRLREMRPVYVRQTSLLKFQDRFTAERAMMQNNVVNWMKGAYRTGLLTYCGLEIILTSSLAIQAYRNKSTIFDFIPGCAFVGFLIKALHSPMGALISTGFGVVTGFGCGTLVYLANYLIDENYETLHHKSVAEWILYRENAELWGVHVDKLPEDYKPPEIPEKFGVGWHKAT